MSMRSSLFAVKVCAVVTSGREVLLVRRRETGLWDLPGGVLRAGEGIVEALRRLVEHDYVKVVWPQGDGLIWPHGGGGGSRCSAVWSSCWCRRPSSGWGPLECLRWLPRKERCGPLAWHPPTADTEPKWIAHPGRRPSGSGSTNSGLRQQLSPGRVNQFDHDLDGQPPVTRLTNLPGHQSPRLAPTRPWTRVDNRAGREGPV